MRCGYPLGEEDAREVKKTEESIGKIFEAKSKKIRGLK